ncbi:MAG: CrcB family protein [Thermoleophilia bacterium]|nr:CrcB family protein [Thermoleophilia bacterium]
MTALLVVMLAGAVGVTLRYALGALITSRAGDGFPWSTLVINVAGAFAMGVLVAVLERSDIGGELTRPAIGIGLLGGFTTFSAFALETVSLVEDGYLARAAAYVGVTNVFGIGALVAGLSVGRQGG